MDSQERRMFSPRNMKSSHDTRLRATFPIVLGGIDTPLNLALSVRPEDRVGLLDVGLLQHVTPADPC